MRTLPNLALGSKILWAGSFAPIFLFIIFLLLLSIIQIQHQVRHLQTQYAEALQQQVALQEEWGKLTLEKHHLTALARVQSLAQTRLKMKFKSEQNFQTILLEKSNPSSNPSVLPSSEAQ